jgi:hypothetical protein
LLNLAAGKLPKQRHGLIGAALSDENFAIANDESSGHKAQRRTGGAGAGVGGGVLHAFIVNETKEMRLLCAARRQGFGDIEKTIRRLRRHQSHRRPSV